MPIVTLTEIAQRLGLSVATVSRALNPATAQLISEPIRMRIAQTAARMGHRPTFQTQRSLENRSYTIGVAMATAFGSFFFTDHMSKFFDGISRVLSRHKRYACKWVVLPRDRSLSEMERYILSYQVDGLLLSSLCDYSVSDLYRLAELFQARTRRPVVAINLPWQNHKSVDVVTFDNRLAARKAVTLLIKRGCRRIGLVYADNNAEDSRERIEGYKEALSSRGLNLRPNWMIRGNFSVESGEKAMQVLLRSKPACDGVFCINDEMAIGALATLRRRGLKCPQDVAVMGFDGLDVGALMMPPLSTIAQPIREIAARAMALLIDRIEGKRRKAGLVLVPARLIARRSA